MTIPYVRRHRYVTISVRPGTHTALLSLLKPRETLDALVLRLIEKSQPQPSTQNQNQEAQP